MKKFLSILLVLTMIVTTTTAVMVTEVNAVDFNKVSETNEITLEFGVPSIPDSTKLSPWIHFSTGNWTGWGYTYKEADIDAVIAGTAASVSGTATEKVNFLETAVIKAPLDSITGEMTKYDFKTSAITDGTAAASSYAGDNASKIFVKTSGSTTANYSRISVFPQKITSTKTYSDYSWSTLTKTNLTDTDANETAYRFSFYAYTQNKSSGKGDTITFQLRNLSGGNISLSISDDYLESENGVPHKVDVVLSSDGTNAYLHLYVDGVELPTKGLGGKAPTGTISIETRFDLNGLTGSGTMNMANTDWYITQFDEKTEFELISRTDLESELFVVPNHESTTKTTKYRTDDYITGVNSIVDAGIKTALETTTPGDKYVEIYASAYDDVTKLIDKSVTNPTVKLVNRTTGAEVAYADATGSLDNYYLKIKGVYITPVKGEDIPETTPTFKVVKSASSDPNGMLFNINGGGVACGATALGHTQYAEDGTPNYPIFLSSKTDSLLGSVMQFDIRTDCTMTGGLSYRLPLNVTTGYKFGNETLTNLNGKFFYITYYLKSLPSLDNAKNDAIVKTTAGIRNTAGSDKAVTPAGMANNYAYNESWQKVSGTLLATENSLGARDLTAGYSTFGGAPFVRFAFDRSPGNYSVQIADLNVVMFDSENTYNSVKNDSALKSLSFNGTALDLSKKEFSFEPEGITKVSQLKDLISYTTNYEWSKVKVELPEYLPGDITITSYGLTADVTNPAETNKTVYTIRVGAETSTINLNANFYSKKADVSALILENEDVFVNVAFYNEKGKMIKLNRFESKATGNTRTFEKALDIPDGAIKAKAFLWNAKHEPLSAMSKQTMKIIKPNFISNGTFEDGTITGWTSTSTANGTADTGHNSQKAMLLNAGTVTQNISTDILNAGQGYYYATLFAKTEGTEELNIRFTVTYRLKGDTADRVAFRKDVPINSEWSQVSAMTTLGDYITNEDGTETLDIASEKDVVSAKLSIQAYKNDSATNKNIYLDDISFSKLSEFDGTRITEISKPSVFVLSDSIGQGYATTTFPRQGWGHTLGDCFGEDINYYNFAASGWSTKTFVHGVLSDTTFSRPVWHVYKNAIKKGDYVIISLGHNDVGSGTKKTTVEEYKANLKTMVDDVRNAGGNVIFVSNLPNVHPSQSYPYKLGIFERYQNVFVPLAEELGVPCINMNLAVTEMENELFKDESYLESYQNARSEHQHAIYLFNLKDNGFIASDDDYSYSIVDTTLGACYDPTHIQYRGAQYVADFLRNQFITKNLPLKDYLAVKETELISNGGFEVGLYDWTVPENRTFTFAVPEGAPQRFNNNFANLKTTGTISQDITIPFKAYGGKKYTLSADVTSDVTATIKVNGVAVATATVTPTAKTAVIDLSGVDAVTNATIELTSNSECTFDNISMK